MVSTSEFRFRRLLSLLRSYSEDAMDQWESWRFDSKHGDVFVSITRQPESGALRDSYDDVNGSFQAVSGGQICRRCGNDVASPDYANVFEQMHYTCFHFEFEHGEIDVDTECSAGGCPSRKVGLATALADWTDWDGAAFALGRSISLYERLEDFPVMKGDFWSANPIGAGLHDALLALSKAGILEHRDEPDLQFKWGIDAAPNSLMTSQF